MNKIICKNTKTENNTKIILEKVLSRKREDINKNFRIFDFFLDRWQMKGNIFLKITNY